MILVEPYSSKKSSKNNNKKKSTKAKGGLAKKNLLPLWQEWPLEEELQGLFGVLEE